MPRNGVLGCHRFHIGNIFDHPVVPFAGLAHRLSHTRGNRSAGGLLMMHNGWQLARMALMTCPGSGLFSEFAGPRFFINRNYARGSRRCHDRILCLPRDLRDHWVREDHESINNRLPPQSINPPGLLFGQRPGEVESEFLFLRRCHRVYCTYFLQLQKLACEI